MTIINRKAELKVAKKIDLWDLANIRLNEGKKSIVDKKYKITPYIKSNGSDCKAFTFEEEKIYMPEIIGMSATDPNFGKHCKHYWQSIYKEFDEFGLTFDISFELDDESKVKEFEKAPENKKHLYGRPVNLINYLLYRYCLEWAVVANTYSIYKEHAHSKRIKYYFHSEAEVKAEQTQAFNLETQAMQSFLKALEDKDIIKGVLRYFERNKVGASEKETIEDVFVYDDLDDDGRAKVLLNISKKAPMKFIELVGDENLKIRTFIYDAMGLKVLTQLAGSSMVMFGDEMLGRNMDEAILSIKTRPEIKNDIVLRAKSKKGSAN